MGVLFSRFRKRKTTIEVLDDLDKKIKDIEQYGQYTEQRHKKIVDTLIYSVALYIIVATIFYFYFFPAKLHDQIFYITPLLIFPIIILFTKKMVSWYYKRKISKNQEKFISMQQEKKKILDEVTETETYKKAKEILIKYAPDQLRMSPLTPQTLNRQSSSGSETPKLGTPKVVPPVLPETELRRRALISSTAVQNPSVNKIGIGSVFPPTPLATTPYQRSGKLINVVTPASKTALPRPILPQQRSYLDRLVEYVVGDGPNNRYALICRQCDSHNGMALKEEFEYFAFRCCYCNFWNPARKQKPAAPKLDFDNSLMSPHRLSLQSDESIESLLETEDNIHKNSCNQSDSDSDIEVVEKPFLSQVNEEINAVDNSHGDDDEIKESLTHEVESKHKELESEKMEVDESPKVE